MPPLRAILAIRHIFIPAASPLPTDAKGHFDLRCVFVVSPATIVFHDKTVRNVSEGGIPGNGPDDCRPGIREGHNKYHAQIHILDRCAGACASLGEHAQPFDMAAHAIAVLVLQFAVSVAG